MTFLLGSSPWEVDEAMVEFGFDIGPFEVQDHIGIDAVFAHIRWSAIDYGDEPWALIPKRIFELGKLGKKLVPDGTDTLEMEERSKTRLLLILHWKRHILPNWNAQITMLRRFNRALLLR